MYVCIAMDAGVHVRVHRMGDVMYLCTCGVYAAPVFMYVFKLG